MRLIQKPNDQSGGTGLRPVRAVYSERMSFGSPRNTKKSMFSSPGSVTLCASKYLPKSNVNGALVCTNMPYPLLLRKNGMGLYMYSFCVPMPSRVETKTFCPRLLQRVNDLPQPKIFSSCCNSKVAAIRRERSLERRTKENGIGVM